MTSEDDPCIAVVKAIYQQFLEKTFEFYQVQRKIPTYSVGTHTRLSSKGYIEVATRTVSHARIWRISESGLKLAKGEDAK